MIPVGNIWETPEGMRAFEQIAARVKIFWTTNVYRYYRHGSGKLGTACDVVLTSRGVVVRMKPLIDLETGYDYGRSIRRGIPEGLGGYDPELGVRTHHGHYPGVPRSKFWLPWMVTFRTEVRSIVRQETRHAIRQYIKRVVR